MTIYIDLDGTILDISERYINLFSKITGLSHNNGIEFWECKKKGMSTKDILSNYGFSLNQQGDFKNAWFKLVEKDNYLIFDKVFPDVQNLLELTYRSENIVICTARQNKDFVFKQLKNLKILNFFAGVLVTEKTLTKEFLIRNYRIVENSNSYDLDWFIGDTFEDMETGFDLGINTCAVLTGLTPIEKFKEARNQPTLIKDSLSSFLNSLSNGF
jgi:phosphoglycolate phosphatase-like HAD superfamily hydrolase